MKLSVVICTRNRAASLARTLAALAEILPPRRAAWEVVVVDNGSGDDTQQVIARFRERLPLRDGFEPEPGISHARNRGVALAEGDYLIWTDDDITFSREWLRSYEQAFEANPRAAFFGGPITPRFLGEPPHWLQRGLPQVASAYGGLEVPEPAQPLHAGSRLLPFGANMAVRAEEQRRCAFDPGLGRHPFRERFLSGEETDVLRRIALAGGTGVWVPEARVEHWVEPTRQSLDYLRRYYAGIGYGQARQQLANGLPPDRGGRRGLRRRIAQKYALYLIGRSTGSTRIWLRALRRGALLQGRLAAKREALAAASPDANS